MMEARYAMEAYGAGGDAVKALLALDGHVGASGSLELDIKGGCMRASVWYVLFLPPRSGLRRMLTLGGVVEVLVDELCRMSAHGRPDNLRLPMAVRTSLAALLRSPKAGTGRATALLTSLASFSVLPKGLGMSEERGEDILVVERYLSGLVGVEGSCNVYSK